MSEHRMGNADDLFGADQAIHPIARIKAVGMRALNVVAAGRNWAGAIGFERLAGVGARLGDAHRGR